MCLIFVYEPATTSTSTTPLRSSQLQVVISGQYTLARRTSLGYLDLSALMQLLAACPRDQEGRDERQNIRHHVSFPYQCGYHGYHWY